ncbi:DUF5325 family protein [Geomicrobium sp. JCM 19039]|uniref:DUF5325 family protein n=1 Tax=Geomicrobium sp. JCM 19039 TaxID=1460636 RepID=UPI00045F3AFE|nr:DUF5325 family protein [Geomicrobium sp. JCM 19039]GAK14215.1 hypothetical protein JCM19039_4117 [Geomicrobium sp. JCM 19039]
MKNIQWPVLFMAVLAVLGISTIGVAVAERSVWIALLALVMIAFAFIGSSKYRQSKTVS